ncbi:hypothetical protein COV05_01015 [Candidatus Uhrbacteria bacterium CG10_big_fil_rev_8_21_14_0_10_48_16]|uniref:Colicin V production protein n=1 Tax=Candidatus Uhrbacteria bacterium CG10_big_fil_rev_8_21_14_0_10_48_16 TaxID=1975038 RepID=A0A2M8LIE5_9BACT|nr:MAG: hypothetical protein COV05_01015 [Candidatus Uhrbacteria bacterium CG10_big_fil_rev_8_21_14_0_10_48_16]
MGFIDIILLVIVGAFVFFGLFFGLIHTIGSIIGSIIGIVAATFLTDAVVNMFGFLSDSGPTKVFVFVVIFLIISRLIGLVIMILEKVFGFFSIIPFAKTINHLLGAGLGFIEGLIIVGVVLFYAMQVLPEDTLFYALEGSFVAKYLVAFVSAIGSLFTV